MNLKSYSQRYFTMNQEMNQPQPQPQSEIIENTNLDNMEASKQTLSPKKFPFRFEDGTILELEEISEDEKYSDW